MQFSKLFIGAVVALVVGLVEGVPTDDSYPLVISKVVPMGEYNLTYWSDAPGSVAGPNAFAARACSGTNDMTCSGSHKATGSICQQLVNSLNTNSGTVIGDSPRSICLGQSGNECCVSWSAAVGSMPQGDLFNAANKIFQDCFGSTISGLARNVNLNGGCVTECLSNRATGCS
ncbi:hypothetical protein B0H15DRAFT_329444 [Mycena belliarum]|uniref:WD-like domain-containing protein n=1 Tax=Mycena belliarum TaxID=1033014 RepID=A0AAD6UGE1_9AGAR|nr:hypothetical protein B0H15DRAFT_329444 [Mycena belliae]